MIEKVCQHCGEVFAAKLDRAKWCSGLCRVAARRQKITGRQSGEPIIKMCRQCGEKFPAKRRDAKWCSARCRSRNEILVNPNLYKEQYKRKCETNPKVAKDNSKKFRERYPEYNKDRYRRQKEADPEFSSRIAAAAAKWRSANQGRFYETKRKYYNSRLAKIGNFIANEATRNFRNEQPD